METTTSFRTIYAAKDARFDVNLISQYHLHVMISAKVILVCVLDVEKTKYVLIEAIELEGKENKGHFVDELQALWLAHPYLEAGYWAKVKVSFFDSHFSMIPKKFHNKNTISHYYQLNNRFDPNSQTLFASECISQDAYLYFAVDSPIIDWLKTIYQNSLIVVNHHNSFLIQSAVEAASGQDLLGIYAVSGVFTLFKILNGKLLYINTFLYRTPEDFVYFVLFVLTELGLKPSESEVKVWGVLPNHSQELRQLAAYVGRVEMGRKVTSMKMGYQFDELPESIFFGLQSI